MLTKTIASSRLPSLSIAENSLDRYMREVSSFPMLTHAEEQELATRLKEHGDLDAAHKLITSHLRLVVKIAVGYRGYGLPMGEVISEGNLGLMQAVKKFEHEKGFRLSTYAMWWIKASIQEYVLRSWSMVKIGTSAAQKRLFFNLKKLKRKLNIFDDRELKNKELNTISEQLGVKEGEVIAMNRRLSGADNSLNQPVHDDSNSEQIDMLVNEEDCTPEMITLEKNELEYRRKLLSSSMENLNEREREILVARRLSDDPKTLGELSVVHNISRERVRQIEAKAIEKLRDGMVF